MWQKQYMQDTGTNETGLRERKRQDTFERIAEASLRLFVAKGFEHTTLDEIAAAAGISRRTFFYYYKSKDDVLVGLQCDGFTRVLETAFDGVTPDQSPFDAVTRVLPELVAAFETPETRLITDIMRSTDALRVRKQAGYVEMEAALQAALERAWPAREQRPLLSLVATASISVLRLALDQWYEDGGKRPLADYARDGFALLRSSLGKG